MPTYPQTYIKKLMMLFAILVLFLIMPAFADDINTETSDLDSNANVNVQHPIYKARVISSEVMAFEPDGFIEAMYAVKVEITSGDKKGTLVDIKHAVSSSDAFQFVLEPKDKILVSVYSTPDNELEWYIEDYQREGSIYLLLFIFIAAIVWVGKGHGIKALMTLALTLLLVWFVLLPLLLRGYSPLLVTVGIATLATGITVLLLSGFSKKSLAAIAGTIAGVVVAAVLAYWIGSRARLTGLSNEEAIMLKFIPQGDIFEARELLYSGILLGTLGAGMDVAMSIASSISEIFKHSPEISRRKLFKSGMNIGRDVMGTMVDTMILAYLGSSLPLILLLTANDIPAVKLMNMDILATEIVRSLTSSVGIVLSLPLTAAIAVMLYKPTIKGHKPHSKTN